MVKADLTRNYNNRRGKTSFGVAPWLGVPFSIRAHTQVAGSISFPSFLKIIKIYFFKNRRGLSSKYSRHKQGFTAKAQAGKY